jgi:ribosomal protein L11 methyltransferase
MHQTTEHRGLLRIYTKPEYVETLSNWISEAFTIPAVETHTPHSPTVQLDSYFDTRLQAEIALRALPDSLPPFQAEAIDMSAETWTTFWQHHFKTEEIGNHLRIVPYWEEAPQDERKNLLINPGLSFGTGGHFTTRFCLEQLEIAIEQRAPSSLIDAGSGSGILSIAGAKLGITSITSFDIDPIAVDQAKTNATLNKVDLHFNPADLLNSAWMLPKADLLCANILSNVLIKTAPKLMAATQQRLILSGIQISEVEQVAEVYTRAGGKEVTRLTDGTWCGLVMDK